MHNGTDFAGPHGTPIYSTADGVVTRAGTMSGYGKAIYIRHSFGLETRYGHLSSIEPSRWAKGSRAASVSVVWGTPDVRQVRTFTTRCASLVTPSTR